MLDAVIAYERGAWSRAAAAAAAAGLPPDLLPAAYADALRYSRELSRDVLAA